MTCVDWDDYVEIIAAASSLASSLTGLLKKASNHLEIRSLKPLLIRDLEKGLDRQLREVNEMRNLALSPSSKLPEDLLRDIFLHSYELSEQVKFPRLISSVCRRWRQVALDTANLWSLVRFPADQSLAPKEGEPWHPWYNPSSGVSAALLPLFASNLQRARGSLLTVELRLGATSTSTSAVQTYQTICQDRTSELFMTVQPSETTVAQLGPCLSVVATTLRQFSMYFLRTDNLNDHIPAVRDLLRIPMPQLRSAVLHEFPIAEKYDSGYLMLLNCQSLTLSLYPFDWITPQHLKTLLECCPQLSTLHLTVPMEGRPLLGRGGDKTRITAPQLRHYTVRFSPFRSRSSSDLAFSWLKAPRLERLGVSIYGRLQNSDDQDVVVDRLQEFLRASSPIALDTLYLREGGMQTAPWILPLLPSLRTFKLSPGTRAVTAAEHMVLWTALADVIRNDSGESMNCPRLETFSTGARALPSYLRFLRDVMRTRREHNFPMSHLTLLGWPTPAEQTSDSKVPSSTQEAYALETALADEVEKLVIGDWGFDEERRMWEEVTLESDEAFWR